MTRDFVYLRSLPGLESKGKRMKVLLFCRKYSKFSSKPRFSRVSLTSSGPVLRGVLSKKGSIKRSFPMAFLALFFPERQRKPQWIQRVPALG